ncbi:MAG: hypothetical protein J7555_00130 [Chloroflexi bacterium]|nr:hypothetical protein [Chloroflexota bacterium]
MSRNPLTPRRIAFLLLFLLVLACNLPRPPSATPAANVTRPAPSPQLPTVPRESPTATGALASSPSAAPPTFTPARTTPSLFLADATRCRQGPGTAFPILTVIPSGAQLPLLGQWDAENYWLVRLDNNTICWVWGGAATPQGSLELLPSVTPPPSPTAIPPQPVTNLRYTYSCSYAAGGIEVSVSLTWNAAANATGYRVYRNDQKIAEVLEPSFAEVALVASLSEVLSYRVEAFNAGGVSQPKTISFSCQ